MTRSTDEDIDAEARRFSAPSITVAVLLPDDDDPPPPSGDVAAQLAALERRVAALETRQYVIAVVTRA